MIKFSKEKVLLLHQLMAEATGGSVDYKQFGAIVFEYDNLSPFFGEPGHTGKVLICFGCGHNRIRIDIHHLAPPSALMIS